MGRSIAGRGRRVSFSSGQIRGGSPNIPIDSPTSFPSPTSTPKSPLGGGIIIPVPAAPKENVGIMSGSMRKPIEEKPDSRGSRPDEEKIVAGNTLYSIKPEREVSRTGMVYPQPVRDSSNIPPEREVPIPVERRQRISRRSDPRGRAPFSPDERGMARDRFFEKMFERSDEKRQQRSMEREERDNVRDSLRSERGLRESELANPGDEREGRRRRRGGGRRRMRGRRRDFTRRRSRMEGGRRGRSGKEMAAFRDRYVSTLGSNFFS